jgi:hypothetical protein
MAKKKLDFKKIAMKTAGLGVGGIGAGFLVGKLPETLDAKIKNLVLIGAGTMLPTVAPKQELVGHVGDGMVAVGAMGLAKEFIPALNGISGIGNTDEYVAGEATTISDIDIEEDIFVETPEEDGESVSSVEEYTA